MPSSGLKNLGNGEPCTPPLVVLTLNFIRTGYARLVKSNSKPTTDDAPFAKYEALPREIFHSCFVYPGACLPSPNHIVWQILSLFFDCTRDEALAHTRGLTHVE